MPKTSAATLRRRARGQDSKPVDPALSAKRKAAAAARWAREKGKDPARVEAARKGGLAATAPKLNRGAETVHAKAWLQNLSTRMGLARAQVHAKAVDGAGEAVDYLMRLVRGVGDAEGAPHAVRRLAALDVIELAGVRTPTGKDMDSKTLSEYTLEELQEFVTGAEQELSAIQIEGEAHHVAE